MKAVLAVKVTHFRLTAKYDIVHIESDTVLYVNISFEEDRLHKQTIGENLTEG